MSKCSLEPVDFRDYRRAFCKRRRANDDKVMFEKWETEKRNRNRFDPVHRFQARDATENQERERERKEQIKKEDVRRQGEAKRDIRSRQNVVVKLS